MGWCPQTIDSVQFRRLVDGDAFPFAWNLLCRKQFGNYHPAYRTDKCRNDLIRSIVVGIGLGYEQSAILYAHRAVITVALYVRHYPCCRCHSVPQPYIAHYRGDDAE